ncbi:MAG: hypothetical protein RIE24_13720 [Silicimonas sp.]
MILGLNGTNLVLESMVKARIEKGIINQARIVKGEHGYTVQFYGPAAEWNGEPIVLCSARNPYEPRQFKSLDGAVSQISRIGFDNINITAVSSET